MCRYEFFNDLYHRFLLTPKTVMKCMCLQAMTIVYGKYWEDVGPFHDTKYIVGMLERVSIFLAEHLFVCVTFSDAWLNNVWNSFTKTNNMKKL